ncbi:uncharacterized protein LOC113634376 [Tachysurus fulvidraco]|uniref:uncharacterized protein LOC113634376 n=1 Tax=Tachysurus fulvidraco TaxID=1234273 RepID=UPI001FEF4707|nr:uncharacterized protein LOC113634376 [Tachysurus fulvidraco]
MRYTFKPDDCMVITIPLTSVRNAAEGQLMPDKFSCRFKDNYKVYQRGWPKALGVAQITTTVFILCLGGIKISFYPYSSFLYIVMILSILHKNSLLFNLNHSARRELQGDEGPLIKHYRVSELVPDPQIPLHRLMKREPAVWAAMQISSGILSIGLGVVFAASFPIDGLLLTLFRVTIVTGILFCFHSNIFCLVISTIGTVLLCVDINKSGLHHFVFSVEFLVLFVTLFDMLISQRNAG